MWCMQRVLRCAWASHRIIDAIVADIDTRRVSPLDSFSVPPVVVGFQRHCSTLLLGTLSELFPRRAQLLSALAQSWHCSK